MSARNKPAKTDKQHADRELIWIKGYYAIFWLLPRSRTSQRQRNNLISRYRDYCKYDRHIDNRDFA